MILEVLALHNSIILLKIKKNLKKVFRLISSRNISPRPELGFMFCTSFLSEFLEKKAFGISSEPWRELLVVLENDVELQRLSPYDYAKLVGKTRERSVSISDLES